ARSLAQRDALPIVFGLALWEEYTRAMLSATIGLPRVLVAYHDLVANPKESVAKLHRDLVAAGASDLQLPNDDVIDPTLDRHQSDDERLLNRSQTELRDALRSGAALEWTFVPPTHPDTRNLLDTFSRNWREIAALQDATQQRSELLDAILHREAGASDSASHACCASSFRRASKLQMIVGAHFVRRSNRRCRSVHGRRMMR